MSNQLYETRLTLEKSKLDCLKNATSVLLNPNFKPLLHSEISAIRRV